MPKLVAEIRAELRAAKHRDEAACVTDLLTNANFKQVELDAIHDRATQLVQEIRDSSSPSIMELFLAEYGLSSEEGVALMCLAEALLRVPDTDTMSVLIEDKIAPSAWGKHLGKSHSSLINASTWALFMTGKVLSDDADQRSVSNTLHKAIKRVGEPVIRNAVQASMKEMGRQFVLGEDINKAKKRAKELEAEGYTYSYDMLGEAAKTDADAKAYHMAYANAITEIDKAATAENIQYNPGISIKLSALFPRYETMKKDEVMRVLMPRARSLAVLAKSAGIGLNIDAEEMGRLDLSLDIIEAVLAEPTLSGWDGFGVVVQAYSKRAPFVIDWLYALSQKLDRKIMVRLVKGAYWDTEIKHAQVEGFADFPVFTRKASTDFSYLACAKQLLSMNDRIYPQFATHNAHSVAAILEMASDSASYEFQRLHGMGETLHDVVHSKHKTRCRIYAPVGAHKDLLAYLVRRLLENGANSSFVNQIVDESVPPSVVAADPVAQVQAYLASGEASVLTKSADLFAPERKNSVGWDLEDPLVLAKLRSGMDAVKSNQYKSQHLVGAPEQVNNPATDGMVGTVQFASKPEVQTAIDRARDWQSVSAAERAVVLNRVADLYEEHTIELFQLLTTEAGKTLNDCVGEVREAVDFLRYYAAQAETHTADAKGIFTCISPWNFPLAIFTGQICAALAAGNGVIAKPAEATSLIADYAVGLMYEAGVPKDVLKLVAGLGSEIGPVVTSASKIDGVCFTGSTQTAQTINRAMAEHLSPTAPLIAETGGLNAMIVDSTALAEQAVTDIIASAFQSAGQRCSALRVLYLQDDIADDFLTMLYGAMDQLQVGDPSDFATDVGPIIDKAAKNKIDGHIALASTDGRLLKQLEAPAHGTFVGPAVIAVDGISDVKEEIFGPVLHIARFSAGSISKVIDDINQTGFGLTFGLHTRVDDRVQDVIEQVQAGNIYVNRNQIGAVVGSQPFGGHGMSGTGPKAGGPRYLQSFYKLTSLEDSTSETLDLPGPTGESNRYSIEPRAHIYCMGPIVEQAREQADFATSSGCTEVVMANHMEPQDLASLTELGAVLYWGEGGKEIRQALAARKDKLVPLVSSKTSIGLIDEVVVCIDTTASGGNAALLAEVS